MVSEETKKMITLEAPKEYWQQGAHEDLRRTTAGKIENLGPSQPYKHPVTGEIRDQHYKYANVTGTPFDMYLNIIPGMHPFHWDVLSAVIAPSSFFLGMVDGLVDNAPVEHEVDKLYYNIVKDGKDFIEMAGAIQAAIGGPPSSRERATRSEIEPTKYFERAIDIEDATGIILELKDGKGKMQYKELYKSLD